MIRTIVSATSASARAELAAIVRSDDRLDLVGETQPAGLDARAAETRVDVVLEDRDDAAEQRRLPTVALVDDPRAAWTQLAQDTEERGAYAMLSRDAPATEITAALIAVAAGLVAVQPRMLGWGNGAEARVGSDSERLTAREIEVLAQLARGVANKAIAAHLGISEHTVKFHVASIFAKLAVSSRTEAVTHGVRLGLIML